MTDRPANVLPGCSVLPAMQTRKLVMGPPPKLTVVAQPKSHAEAKTTSNRFAELNSFVDRSMVGLTRVELATWLVLWRDTRNGTVRTSVSDVARRAGATRRAATDAMAKLRKRRLLTVITPGGMNRGASVQKVHSLPQSPDEGHSTEPLS